MPSFLGRKYMRGKPGTTEKRVGVLVLVLLAFIVGAFLLTGGLWRRTVEAHPALARLKSFFGISEKPLFLADPANMPPAGLPHELRIAETLLPALLGQPPLERHALRALPLRAPTDSQPADDTIDPEFRQAMQAANARWIFTCDYGPSAGPVAKVAIADLGEPIAAYAACKSRTPSGGRTLTLGRGGWQTNDRAAFWSGRYYTEVQATQASAGSSETVARQLAGFQLAYGVPLPASAPAVAAKPAESGTPAGSPGVARFAEVPGGRIAAPTRVERYAENLYEKIDGKESAFRAFFVVDLRFAQYADPDAQQAYDVYLYDMTAPENAFGIYMSERVPKATVVEVGRDGYSSGTSVFCWKGRYYVNVLGPPDGGEAALRISNQIATAVVGTIADDGQPFWAEAALPAEDRVPFSFSYQATSALGYEYLTRMWSARYEADGHALQMYITRATDAEAARALFARFADSIKRYDKVLARETPEGGEIVLSETPLPNRPSKFGAAFHKGPYFGGISASDDAAFAAQRVKRLFDALSASDAGDPAAATAAPVNVDTPHDAPAGEGESGSSEEAPASESSEGSESGH